MIAGTGLGLVVAMASEAKLLSRGPLQPGQSRLLAPGVRLLLSGMGEQAAGNAARQLVDEGVEALAVIGVAGGLDPDYPAGSVICASEICTTDGQRHPTDAAWRQALHLATRGQCRVAPLLGSAVALSTPVAKHDAASRHGAVAVDMESGAVAAVAAAHDKPLLVLRAIADEAGDILPEALQHAVDPLGQPRPWPMLVTLLRHPGLITVLPGLARRMQAATRGLQQIIAQTGPDLAWSRRQHALRGG